MVYVFLVIYGLAAGSFINALTWRIYMQGDKKRRTAKINGKTVDLSVVKGRSVCTHCGHQLGWADLIPFFSWAQSGGKCRYCKKPINDWPVVELAMPVIFITSYAAWPYVLEGFGTWLFLITWLLIVICLVALIVYDLRHMILPNRIMYPLFGLAVLFRFVGLLAFELDAYEQVIDIVVGVLAGGGLFYLLHIISNGKWIGGGDVRLGFLMGVVLGVPDVLYALTIGFYAATALVLPLLLLKKVDRKSHIPFGPFLILGLLVTVLWSAPISNWFTNLFGL